MEVVLVFVSAPGLEVLHTMKEMGTETFEVRFVFSSLISDDVNSSGNPA